MRDDHRRGSPMLRRPHLEARLDEGRRRRLTVVTGGAGSGKSTVLRQWLHGSDAAWHTARAENTSLPIFVRGIVDELRLHVPDLSTDLLLAAEGPSGPDTGATRSRTEALAARLCEDLGERLTTDLVLVIDDVHVLGSDGPSTDFLAGLCRNAPDLLHIVTASRETLPFATSRMQVAGDAAEITAEELAFDRDEIGELIAMVTGSSDDAWADQLLERTAGWPVAVVFAIRGRSRRSAAEDATEKRDDRTLFTYLAEEVIAGEPPGHVLGLRTAAELPWVAPDLLAELAIGDDHGLFDPTRQGVYVSRAPGHPEGVTLSPLVRDFVIERRRLPDGDRTRIATTAARWYASHDALPDALSTLLTIDEPQAIVDLLESHGEELLAAGLSRLVVDSVATLADDRRSPTVRLLEAEAHQTLGDWESALRCYEILTPPTGSLPPGLAWRHGFLRYMQGAVGEALDIYERGRLDGTDPFNEGALLGWMATAHWLRGERDEAQKLAAAALELARSVNDSRALATAHTVLAMVAAIDGDRVGNDTHYLRALDHAERARDVVQTIRIRSNRGSYFLEEGRHDRALAELEIALRLADMTGFAFWRGMALTNRAEVVAATGRLDEAIADFDQARNIFRRLGSSFEAYPLAYLGDVSTMRGDPALARAMYRQAIALAEAEADQQAMVPALSGLAISIADEDPAAAMELAARACAVDSVLGRVSALLARGHAEMASDERTAALATALEAAEVATARRDMTGLARALELQARLADDDATAVASFEKARSLWEDTGVPVGVANADVAIAGLIGGADGAALARRAGDQLQHLGAKGPAHRARAVVRTITDQAERDVVITTLGGFSVARDGEPVPNSAWQSRVARQLLRMLVANRGRPLHREVLIDRLWPDDDPAKASNRLSVALSTIRRALDPDKSHDPDYYVVGDRDTLGLAMEHLTIDVEVFLEEAARGRSLMREGEQDAGLARLSTAEALYVGEFLEEQPYAEWAVGLREEARAVYMSFAGMLAEHHTGSGDDEAAARQYLRILERDTYDEVAHLGLVAAMVRTGRHGTARRLYGIYVSRMSELDVEPAPFPSSGASAGVASSMNLNS